MPFFDLAGKIALVTGAGQGLGHAIALRLAQAGAHVAVNDIDAAKADMACNDIAASGGKAISAPGDVADEASVAVILQQVLAVSGRIDILVNNAGIVSRDDIFDIDKASWDRVLRVNLTGPFLCSQATMRQMREQGSGVIVMVGSMVGHQGALSGWPHYGATKSGLHGLAKTLARAGAPFGITVNTVAPGVIQTEMLERGHPGQLAQLQAQVLLGRLGSSADVAGAVHYLCSDEARYLTGATIDVNGGMYIRA